MSSTAALLTGAACALVANHRFVNARIRDLLQAGDGVIDRRQAEALLPPHLVAYAVRAGHVAQPFPETIVDAERLGDFAVVLRAAIQYAGMPVAVSHISALRVWGLPVPEDAWLHLTTDNSRHLRGVPGLRVHRREYFSMDPPYVVLRQDLPVMRLETAIVDSWPLLDAEMKRAPAIEAVGRWLTTAERLMEALEYAPRLAGRRHLVELLGKLAAGCRSPLELWGYDSVFHGGDFAGLSWQVPVKLGERTVYLDALDERSRVNFELDGARFHTSPTDRERDLRRDAALAALGFTVVRFSGRRLRREPEVVRVEALRVLEAHRRP